MFYITQNSYQVLQTKKKGRGVFATQKIQKGTVIGEYSGKTLPYYEIDEADYPFLMYFSDEKGIVADKNEIGVHLLNHSCDPNCTMSPKDKHMEFIAIKDIAPGQELTISYMYPPQDTCTKCEHKCFCGSKNCLGTMHTSKNKYDSWQKFLEEKLC